jgi:superfamily I DNA/RNA helicase
LVEYKLFPSEDEAVKKIFCANIKNIARVQVAVVVLLEMNKGYIPSTVLDGSLFEIFGEDAESGQKYQKYLFYMVMTRAIEKLYLFFEEEKKSEYLKLIKPIEFKNIK